MTNAARILISGDVCGHLSSLFKRVAAIWGLCLKGHHQVVLKVKSRVGKILLLPKSRIESPHTLLTPGKRIAPDSEKMTKCVASFALLGKSIGICLGLHPEVNKSNGPFDALVCVGQFFPSDPSAIEEVQEYIEGKKEIPLPTYFIGDYGEGAALLLSASTGKAAQAGFSTGEISVCDNLVWLKGSGTVNIRGLRVAYLGGKFNASFYHDAKGAASAGAHHEDDVDALRAVAEDKAVTDLFLSNEWPQAVTSGVILAAVPVNVDKSTGTSVAAELAMDLKPRYHFAGTEGVYYAREPYLNPGAVHSTRFIGLAAVGNDKRQKFLHALSLTPASVIVSSDLARRPPNLTVSPYELSADGITRNGGGSRGGRKMGGDVHSGSKGQEELQDPEGQYWRYDLSRSKRQKRDDGDRVCMEFVTKGTCSREGNCRFKHDLGDGTPIPKGVCFDFLMKGKCERGPDCRYRHTLDDSAERGEYLPPGVCFDFFKTGSCDRGADCRFSHNLDSPAPRAPSGPCWFCLSSPDVSTHLVISVGDHCYCALAKGPIMQGHVLLLPIEHFPSTVSLPSDTAVEMQKYKQALRECYESRGHTILVFERYIQLRAGTHAHLQVFPVPLLKALGARQAFVSAAEQEGFKFQEIPPGQGDVETRQALKTMVQGQNYFFVELSDKTMLVRCLEDGAKMSMQFGREVVAKILGKPDRGDWKACTLSREEETDMTEEFKQQFASFDPMS